MSTPLLATKLYLAPPRSNLVSRPHLLERLNDGLGRKLTLISAPPGFGKTTLLATWLASWRKAKPAPQPPGAGGRTLQIGCVSLDRADNDPARFWTYFAAAVKTVRPEAGEIALGMLQSPQPPPVEALVTALVNAIAEEPEPLVIVLDDYHVIRAEPIHTSLVFLLDHLPPGMHLVVATRTDPPWPLARWRVRAQMTELRAADLRFAPDETTAFLNQAMKLGLEPEEIAALEQRTEGWIAGLHMAALALQGTCNPPGQHDIQRFISGFTGSQRFIFDYLLEEVLQQQPPSIQAFLLKTSLLDRLNASLCDAVLDTASAPENQRAAFILNYLERSNLFIISLDSEQRWYRYHHLFAGLLRRRLEQSQPASMPGLHQRASAWYESQDLIEEAVAHAFASCDLQRAADLVYHYARRIHVQTNLVTLSGWLEALPEELICAHPWLCAYQALAWYWTGRRDRIEERLQTAEQILQLAAQPPALSAEEKQHLAGYIAAIRAHLALVSGNIPRVLAMAEQALQQLPPGDYMRGWTSTALGGAYWGRGDVLAAQAAFTAAQTVALQHGYRFLAVPPACYVGMQWVKRGKLDDALRTYREAAELAIGADGRQLPVAGFPNVKIGDVLRERNELEAASRHLHMGVEQCVQLGHPDVLADGYAALARLQLTLGDLDAALATLQNADQVAGRSPVDPFVRCWLDECRVRLWISAKNLAAASQWAQASGLTVEGELSYHFDLHHLNLARVLVAEGLAGASGSLKPALGLLERLLTAAEAAGWINEAIKTLVLQALAFQGVGSRPAALNALGRALSLAEPGGYIRVFIDEGVSMQRLLSDGWLREAEKSSPLHGYVERLLAASAEASRPARPDATRHKAEAPIEPLSERELEILRLLNLSLTSTEISERLYISVSTVRTHIKNIYSKLNANRRVEALRRAAELGLI